MAKRWFKSQNGTGPSHKAPARLGSSGLSLLCAPGNGAEKGDIFMSYLNSVTIIGFVGADPEQRQARNNNGSKFTVLSVATQRSWKNTDDEWASKTEWHRVCVFRPRLAEYVATTIKKGSHVLVEGSLVSTTYERGKADVLVHSRRCRSQARSRRTRTGDSRVQFSRFE